MASRGPLAGAARLFSTDRLDDMERRYKETVTLLKHGYLPRASGVFVFFLGLLQMSVKTWIPAGKLVAMENYYANHRYS